ncbi:MAG: penicillin-binding protein 2 [Actinomycetota bacterium]|nr:penicillin-binding protein 2 [Actinomycetota bacterium]
MNRQISRLAAVLMAAYLILFVQLNVIQLVRADEYKANDANTRDIVIAFTEARGAIRTADNELIAETVATHDELKRLRAYTHGELYAHITGFLSLEFGADGLERQYNDELSGADVEVRIQNFSDLFIDRDRTGQLELTIRHDVQLVARAALGDRKGAVVAIEPSTGAVLSMWSWPSYDPNDLAGHDIASIRDRRFTLLEDPDNPLRSRAYRERYAPGSTFKAVTAAGALMSGTVTQDAPVYPVTAAYLAPQTTRPITNFGGSACGGNLGELLRVSCNTAFAEMGVQMGADVLVRTAEAFGFNDGPGIDLPDTVESVIPEAGFFDDNIPLLAQSAIGQFEVAATPLQMATIAATIANDGIQMRPRIVQRVTSFDGDVIHEFSPHVDSRPLELATAQQLQALLANVVANGTARSLQLDGIEVAAKTGTAEIDGTDGTHAWIIAVAPVSDPQVAVAVLVEGDDTTGQQTGGNVAGPVAKAVIEAVLQLPTSTDTPTSVGSNAQN